MLIQLPIIVLNFNIINLSRVMQHVHTQTHLHGHILDLILTPADLGVVSNVWVGGFTKDHVVVHDKFDFISRSASRSNTVTFCRYDKIKMHSLQSDLC